MMKKVITLITVFSMLVCLAVPVQAVNTVLVDEDFSSYEGGNTLSGWTVEADASRLTAVEDDYGTAIKVTTSASSNIIKRVFEAQTSGQILLTADVKVNTSANPVVYLSNADGSQRTSVSVKNPNKVGEWTKVNFLLDITANTIERWFDEDYTSASTSDFKVTSCSVLFFANWAPVDNGGYIIIDNVKVTVLPQEFSVSSSGAHSSAYDVFNVGTEKSYTFNYKNTDNANKNISVEITAKNNAGSTIKTHTYAKEVKAGARYSEKFVFECANQTVGNVSVRLTVDGDVANYLNYKFICANTKARIAKATPASGVNTHMGQGRAAANTVLMSKPTGVATVRDGIEWWRCETTKGTIKVPNDLDPMINTAYENGTEILFLLSYGNTLYSSSEKDIPTTTEYKNAWLNYVEYIVTRYKDKVDYWQVWNEPNISTFNANNATVAQYTELLRITYNKIKSIDPTSKVIGGGLAGSGNTDTIPYLQSMLSNGAGNYMDILDVHPYKQTDTPEGYMAARLPNIKNTLTNAGVNIPIWVGELGWYSGTASDSVSDSTQAAYLVRSRVLYDGFSQNNGQDGKFFWYDFQNDGTDATNSEHNYGITNNDFSPKPAYYAYSTFNAIVGNRTMKDFEISSGIYKATYGNDAYVLWKPSGTGTKTVTLSGDIAKVYNLYGDLQECRAISREGTDYTVSVSSSPVFIKTEKGDVFDIWDVAVNGNRATVSGVAYPKADISVSIWAENASSETVMSSNVSDWLSGANQITADENGYFEITMPITAGDKRNYTLCLATKGLEKYQQILSIGTETAALLRVIKNGVEVKSLKNVKAGDTITIQSKYYGDLSSVLLIGKVSYDRGFDLSQVAGFNKGNKTSEVTFTIGNDEDVSAIEIFLWDGFSNMVPLHKKETVK